MFVTLNHNKFLYNNVNFRAKNKFVKLAHLVGFIINKFCDNLGRISFRELLYMRSAD
jgi:hypothetical protein